LKGSKSTVDEYATAAIKAVELDDYFKYDEESKDELAFTIVEYFMPYIKSHPLALSNVIRALKVMVDESEYYEEYERADLFNRCRIKYEEITFL
jgi:hypothetical protein